MKSLKQLALLAFVETVEQSTLYRDSQGYVAVALPDEAMQNACLQLLARRGNLTSSALRPLLASLRHADLSLASPSLDVARAVQRAPLLGALALRGRMSDQLAARLPPLPSLRTLDVSCCPRLGHVGLAHLVAISPALVSLSLSFCSRLSQLVAIAPPHLSHLHTLDARHLPALELCPDLWPPFLSTLLLSDSPKLQVANFPDSLRYLEMSGCTSLPVTCLPCHLRGFVGRRLISVPSLPVSLLSLDLSDSPLLTSFSAPLPASLHTLLLEACPKLTGLDYSNLAHLSTLSLCHSPLTPLPHACHSLVSLSLAHHPQANSANLISLFSRCEGLSRVDLSFCAGLSDDLLDLVPESVIQLRLFGCVLLSLPALARLRRRLPALLLHSADCP